MTEYLIYAQIGLGIIGAFCVLSIITAQININRVIRKVRHEGRDAARSGVAYSCPYKNYRLSASWEAGFREWMTER